MFPHELALAQRLVGHAVGRLVTTGLVRPQDRADLFQDIFLAVWRVHHRYRANRGAAATYLTTVIRHAAADHLRHRRTRRRKAIIAELPSGGISYDRRRSEDSGTADSGGDLAETLGTLPPDLADLAGRLLEGTVSGIARDLDIPRSTLQRRIHRLRRHLIVAGYREPRARTSTQGKTL